MPRQRRPPGTKISEVAGLIGGPREPYAHEPLWRTMLQVWTDPFFRAHVDYRLKVVLVTRSARPFRSAAEITTSYARLERELQPYASIERAIVVDSRAPPQLEPALEPDFVVAAGRLFTPFRTCCVLVGTPSGLTQGRRVRSRSAGQHLLLITSSYADAAAHIGAPGLVKLLQDIDAVAAAGR